ncbi:MAG: flagellar biosynthetic protein FliO [Acetatifactor sp.]|nr:flagellar biosynthetic protein FliO [Acetatifactor sp.]
MFILLTATDSYLQFITVLVVFVLVLAVTAYTTKWIANYQKKQAVNCNIEVVETAKLGGNKWLQIVRVGETYKVIAVCKDTVTLLGEVPKEQLKEVSSGGESLKFRDLFDKAVIDRRIRKNSDDSEEPKD